MVRHGVPVGPARSPLDPTEVLANTSLPAYVMLAILFVALTAALFLGPLKLMQLRRVAQEERTFQALLASAATADELSRLASSSWSAPGARVLRAVIEARSRRLAFEYLMGVARRAIVEERRRLVVFLPTIALIASAAPMLGLFGTVWGIIEAFLTIGTTKSSELPVIAPAMSGALLTTALGLMAAMPASVAYHYVTERLDQLVDELETSANTYVGLLASARET